MASGPLRADGELVDFDEQKEATVRELIHEMIDWFHRDVIDELGTLQGIECAYKFRRAAPAPTGS